MILVETSTIQSEPGMLDYRLNGVGGPCRCDHLLEARNAVLVWQQISALGRAPSNYTGRTPKLVG